MTDPKLAACQRFLADFKALRFPVTICVDGQKRLDFMATHDPKAHAEALEHIRRLNLGRAYLERLK